MGSQMDCANLCEHCLNINFEALRLPLKSDLADLQRGQPSPNSVFFKKRDEAEFHKPTSLGSLSRILSESQRCALCRLFGQIITRETGYSVSGVPSEQIQCRADTNYYAVFRNPSDESKFYWLRRMSILARAEESKPTFDVHFAFQACDAGAASLWSEGTGFDPDPKIDRMLFGGRKRPLLLNLQWVRRWLHICDESHGVTCQLVQTPESFNR